MSTIWIVMIVVGILTFLIRLSFTYLFANWEAPEVIQRGLRFVPIAALTAIFIPEILLIDGEIALSPVNLRLIAGIIAILVAWRTKSALWTIAIRMASFWLFGRIF